MPMLVRIVPCPKAARPVCGRRLGFALWLAPRVSVPAAKAALKKLSIDLMEEVNATQRELGLKEVGEGR